MLLLVKDWIDGKEGEEEQPFFIKNSQEHRRERERKKALFTHSKTWHGNLVLSFFSLLILLSSQLSTHLSERERTL